MKLLFTAIVMFFSLSSLSLAYSHELIKSDVDGIIELKTVNDQSKEPTVYLMASHVIKIEKNKIDNGIIITSSETSHEDHVSYSAHVLYLINFKDSKEREMALKQILSELSAPK